MSPFVSVGSALRELWAGMNPPKDEDGGGGSGATSRRHSVSFVQPRRPTIVGFNVPGHDTQDESAAGAHSRVFHAPSFGRGGFVLSDDDLAADLGSLSLSKDVSGPSSSAHPPSQPSSLPIYVPVSRSPLSSDRMSPYQRINLNIPTGTSFASHAQYLAGGNNGHGSQQQQQQQQQQSSLTARFISGKGIQYLPQGKNDRPPYNRSTSQGSIPSPLSPTTGHLIQPQQGPFYPQQMQRRSSDAPVPNVNDLAGRTDPFYLTDLSLDIRVGDLVIVEADRGKDLGTVVNDSTTLKEVEAFEREQGERVAYGDGGPLSPGGQQGSKKEINPKMIYGKAQPQDRQQLLAKAQDELKALQLCQNKVRQKKLPMERIDFRELVRELFRLYETRIWMASLQGPGGYEQ
ncbi:hypothetical protein EDD15DRAFT_2389916 [Pisolithus albus]|nr:hypothetical protein EDD15DRAFT_2389916 [Pisolithus albus]